MRSSVIVLIALAIVALVASPALAQQPPRGFGGGFGMTPATLVGQESVQADLKLDDATKRKLEDFAAKQREGGREFFQSLQGLSREDAAKKFQERAEATEKELGQILNASQMKRLKEIALQVRARQGRSGLFEDRTVAEALKLTDEQREKLQAIREDGQRFRQELGIQRGQRPTEEQQKKLEDFRKSTDEKLQGMLSADQKAKLKEMMGAEFKGEIRFGRPGGGGGGGRPPIR